MVHLSCVWLLMGLVTLHVVVAVKHLLVERDGVFQRIWPFAGGSSGEVR